MTDKKNSGCGIFVAIATSVASALIIKAVTTPPSKKPAADVRISAFDVGAMPFVTPGQRLTSHAEVHNDGTAVAEQCKISVGFIVSTNSEGDSLLLVSGSHEFSVSPGETKDIPLSPWIPENARGSATANASLVCKNLPKSEVERSFSIIPKA